MRRLSSTTLESRIACRIAFLKHKLDAQWCIFAGEITATQLWSPKPVATSLDMVHNAFQAAKQTTYSTTVRMLSVMLVLHALKGTKASPAELEAVRSLLDEMEGSHE